MSCNLLTREPSIEGKVPTTPTISSIIAGIQVQEAVKLIHGIPTLSGQGFVFEGLHHTSYRVDYTETPECMSHYTLQRIVELPQRSEDLTLDGLAQIARRDLGSSEVAIEFSRDVIHKLVCAQCGAEEELFVPVGSVEYEQGRCPRDGQMRVVETLHGFSGKETFGDRALHRMGLPLFDIFTARSGESEIGYLFGGDRTRVLGSAAGTGKN
jgi:adenylyltransferase/sulfurtransferase